jgi:TolA-binding protein
LIENARDQSIAVNAMLELAELELKAGEKESAIERLAVLCETTSTEEMTIPAEVRRQALHQLAVVRFESSQFDQAAALCERLLADNPPDSMIAPARLLCGEAHFKADNPAKALPHFSFLVDAQDDNASLETCLLRLGECQAATQRWADSESTFDRHRKRFPESENWFQSQFGIGWARENLEQHQPAIDAYTKVIEKHDGITAARAQFQIGECLYAMKRHDDAILELMKVDILYAYPEWSAAALYEAGRCFDELSQRAEARTQFEQVIQRFPKSRWAELATQRLAEHDRHAAAAAQSN